MGTGGSSHLWYRTRAFQECKSTISDLDAILIVHKPPDGKLKIPCPLSRGLQDVAITHKRSEKSIPGIAQGCG